jgi:hypothetical protein
MWNKIKNPLSRGFFLPKKKPQNIWGFFVYFFYSKLLREWAIVFTDNSLLTSLSVRNISRVILLTLELVRSTSLEECLLVAHKELFAWFVFFADWVADHREWIGYRKISARILSERERKSNLFRAIVGKCGEERRW